MINRLRIATPSGVLLIEPIAEEEALERKASAEELSAVEGFKSASRRRERLAWRALLREELGEGYTIEYAESGAPRIVGARYPHISVSHSQTHVAVLLSAKPCGVDIESLGRNFERIESRYVLPEERELSTEHWWPAALWASKEALYKMAGKSGLELLHDLKIIKFVAEDCNICAKICDEQAVELQLLLHEDQVVVYTL